MSIQLLSFSLLAALALGGPAPALAPPPGGIDDEASQVSIDKLTSIEYRRGKKLPAEIREAVGLAIGAGKREFRCILANLQRHRRTDQQGKTGHKHQDLHRSSHRWFLPAPAPAFMDVAGGHRPKYGRRLRELSTEPGSGQGPAHDAGAGRGPP